jgi:inorganic phosphate transporter, PiT family
VPETTLLVIVIVLAVLFDFINGFHDTANAIATVIATRVLSPLQAILMATGLNFVGAIMGTAVAHTIGTGLVEIHNASLQMLAATLIAAIGWNLFTWWRGIPSSSSHALIGGLIGASIAQSGTGTVQWLAVLEKIILPLLLSPILGFIGTGVLLVVVLRWFGTLHPYTIGVVFGRLQLLSSALMAYSHGGNDAQKTMGVITLALVISGVQAEFHVPFWVSITAGSAMALGTAIGGWRIIRTLSTKLGRLKPIDGFAAETAAATVIETASQFGLPLSTTQVVTAAILGSGVIRQRSNVQWNVAANILIAWIVTLPFAAGLGYGLYCLAAAISGQ